jgi:hypothetical protein
MEHNFKGKLHKKVSIYRSFSIKGTDTAKRSIKCMHLSKPFYVGYSVRLWCLILTEVESRDFQVIFNGVLPIMPLKEMLNYT